MLIRRYFGVNPAELADDEIIDMAAAAMWCDKRQMEAVRDGVMTWWNQVASK